MAKTSKVFAYLGAAFGFAVFFLLLLFSILGFIGAFKFIPSFFDESSRMIFYVLMVIYSLLELAVAYLSLRHYLLLKKDINDSKYDIFLIADGILTLNIFLIVSALLSLIMLKKAE